MEGRQLTLDLFAQLDEAVRLPEEMSVSELLGRLDRTLVGMPRSQQMVVAGEALTQLVGAFAARAELLLLDWEDRYNGPLVDEAWLAGLGERPPSFNLAAYETEPIALPKPPKRVRSSRGARVRYVSKAKAIAQAEREQAHLVEEIAALAHDEGVRELEGAIALLLRERGGEAGLCELAEVVAGGRAIAVLLVTLLSSELTLVCVAEGFYLSLKSLRIRHC